MNILRQSHERGRADFGWLDSRHSFSFGNYYDPAHMGFGALRVINEDKVAPGAGFGEHGHEDMEIISYVLEGAMAHQDSLGNGSVMRPGDVQRMSAGTGIRHSEFNHSDKDPLHFLQIWIIPEKRGLEPGYEQKTFSVDERRGQLRLIGSRDGRAGSVIVHQDVDLYGSVLGDGESVTHELRDGRKAWLQVARGTLVAGDQALYAGDGLAIGDPGKLTITATDDVELLLFDLAA